MLAELCQTNALGHKEGGSRRHCIHEFILRSGTCFPLLKKSRKGVHCGENRVCPHSPALCLLEGKGPLMT